MGARTVANVEQAAAWDGSEGEYWTDHADRYQQTSRRHRDALLAAGVVAAQDSVLDVGCGIGALTRDVIRIAHALGTRMR